MRAIVVFQRVGGTKLIGTDFRNRSNVRARLAGHTDEVRVSLAESVARSLRAHIRILSRAIFGSTEAAPGDLVQALIDTVHAGALKHDEKGRVAAFAPRYEVPVVGKATDRPIAADLGAALSTLIGEDQERLLTTILGTDEPMLLAQLLSFAPHAVRARIEQRIKEFTPTEAGTIQSLTEAQARIKSLLVAGHGDAAARFIDAERDLKTLAPVGGRELTRLRAILRLQLSRGEWDAIARTEPPPGLSTGEQPLALETIEFYKAIAALQNPADGRQVAEQLFSRLYARHSSVPAYAVNLVAARISLLLGGDLFARLRGAALARGRQVLAEAEQMMLHVRSIDAADTEIFSCNKALLLLALGQGDQAYQLLVSLRPVGSRGTIAAYSAVALERMGRGDEAAALLEQARREFGVTDVLLAAQEHVQSGRAFAAIPEVSSETDPVDRITGALLHFKEMSPDLQARILYPGAEALDAFVIGHVRSATASLVSLVPRIGRATLHEDDLTAILSEHLAGRIEFVGWSAPDQSPGGFSAKENPGKRDLLLKKGSSTLTVIEAVVCDRPVTHDWTRKELASHFQKVLGYSTCRLFFHLTYSYIENPASILTQLKYSAEHDVTAGFTHRCIEDIPFTDSRPVGFAARYEGEFGEIKVIFLVLDLGQHHQVKAAKSAAATNPRNKKQKS